MRRPDPILAAPATMARLLDMTPKQLAALVDGGALPGPRLIGGLERYDVDELRRVIRGETIGGEMQWA